MAEKHEFAGSGSSRHAGVFLALSVLGVIVVGFGILTGFNPVVVGIGVILIGVGLSMWMLSSGNKTLTVSDIYIKFMRGERLIFEAVWGEIDQVTLGKRQEEGPLTLRFEFQLRRPVEITGDLDFPDETLEDIFYKIRNIKEKYRYSRLNVEKGKIKTF